MRLLLTVLLIVLCKKCDSADCFGKKCVQKCCPNKQYVTGIKMCAPSVNELDFDHLPVFDKNMSQVGSLNEYFGVKPWGFSDADFKEFSLRRTVFSLMENGSVRVLMDKERSNMMTFDPEYYCLDYRLKGNETVNPPFVWISTEKHQDNEFLTYSLLVSSVFLLLVLVVYCLLPELRNLGGLVLMCYVGSLLLAYIFLFVVKSTSFSLGTSSCIAITLLVCYFFFSAFCWMSVMSYDIWWTFRGYAKARPIHRRGERYKFKIYSLFAWGIPLAITVLTGVMNSVDKARVPGIITPDIPNSGCFLAGAAQLMYFYVPMLIFIVCNWLFYLMTAFNIWRLSRGSKVLNSADSSASGTASARRINMQRFLVYLKLTALMGLSWILEVISYFSPKFTFWVITDAYNIFIGLMIFIIFVCKKKILMKLKKRFREPKLGHQVSTSFTTRSRSTLESNPLSMPLKTQGSISHQP